MIGLFDSCKIGSMTVENRIVMAPMATISDPDGGFSKTVTDYFVERAKGGAGLIISGALMVSGKLGNPPSGRLDHGFHTARLRRLSEEIHRYHAKFCIEYTYGNGRCGCNDPANPPWSASPVPTMQYPGVLCREMPVEDIQELITQTGVSARLAKQAGVDAVMLHAYAGYLLDQFQSSEWNKRRDTYGGSLENRMRFTADLIAQIKKECGEAFPVLVKVSVDHCTETGRKLEEGVEMCKILEAAGADALMVAVGSFETRWHRCIPTVYEKEGFSLPAAQAVKKAVGIPVIGQNKLSDPSLAADAIAGGLCDLVALGHGLLADPYWPRKVRNGMAHAIRPCIGCNECFRCISSAQTYRCSVNPILSREKDLDYIPSPARAPQKVLVVGAGPGGVVAAVTAARCGHDVTLWEARDRIGGNLIAAGTPPFKKDIRSYVGYLEQQLADSSVSVVLRKTASEKEILKGAFDQIILATGSRARGLQVKGADQKHVLLSLDALLGKEPLVGNVVVIGGGLVGCEIALYAMESAETVTLLETLPNILTTTQEARNNELALKQLLAESQIEIICSAVVTRIDGNALRYTANGTDYSLACDKVILATGYLPENHLENRLVAQSIAVTVIGDAKFPRNIIDAVSEGYFSALDLELESKAF